MTFLVNRCSDFIYQYLTGEKSWTYVPPRSFSWIGGSSFQDELDQIWDNIWDGDNNTEEDKSGDEDPSQGGNWWDGFWPPKHPLKGFYSQ